MPLITNWNGTAISTSESNSYWSNKGGLFSPSKGQATYFPLPAAYRSAIKIVGKYTVPPSQKNRPDMIAYQLYGSEDYWWLVLWMNNLTDPFSSLNIGDTILIADLTDVNSLLG